MQSLPQGSRLAAHQPPEDMMWREWLALIPAGLFISLLLLLLTF